MNYTHNVPAGYLVTDTEAALDEVTMDRAETLDYMKKRISDMGPRYRLSRGSLDDPCGASILFFSERPGWDGEMIIVTPFYAD